MTDTKFQVLALSRLRLTDEQIGVARWLAAARTPVGLLAGPSGAGKTLSWLTGLKYLISVSAPRRFRALAATQASLSADRVAELAGVLGIPFLRVYRNAEEVDWAQFRVLEGASRRSVEVVVMQGVLEGRYIMARELSEEQNSLLVEYFQENLRLQQAHGPGLNYLPARRLYPLNSQVTVERSHQELVRYDRLASARALLERLKRLELAEVNLIVTEVSQLQ